METKNNELDQLTALVQNTKRIAEALIINRQMEHNSDHKVDIIGTAMIEQRDTLQELAKKSAYVHEEMLNQISRANQNKDNIEQLIEQSDQRFLSLQKTHDMQHEFVASFDRLQEKHQSLIDANNDNYEEHQRTTKRLIDAVTQLQSRIERVDTIEQTQTFTDEASALLDNIQTYLANRETFKTQLQTAASTLHDEIQTFTESVQTYREEATGIRQIVEVCSDQATMIDRKLDAFIEQYRIKMCEKTKTLDDAFEQPKTEQPKTEEAQSKGLFAKIFRGGSSE